MDSKRNKFYTTHVILKISSSIVTDNSFQLVICNFEFFFVMTCNYQKSTKQIFFASSFALLMLFSGTYGIQNVFAEDEDDFIPIASDRIKNDPFLVKILENIEKSKKRIF